MISIYEALAAVEEIATSGYLTAAEIERLKHIKNCRKWKNLFAKNRGDYYIKVTSPFLTYAI